MPTNDTYGINETYTRVTHWARQRELIGQREHVVCIKVYRRRDHSKVISVGLTIRNPGGDHPHMYETDIEYRLNVRPQMFHSFMRAYDGITFNEQKSQLDQRFSPRRSQDEFIPFGDLEGGDQFIFDGRHYVKLTYPIWAILDYGDVTEEVANSRSCPLECKTLYIHGQKVHAGLFNVGCFDTDRLGLFQSHTAVKRSGTRKSLSLLRLRAMRYRMGVARVSNQILHAYEQIDPVERNPWEFNVRGTRTGRWHGKQPTINERTKEETQMTIPKQHHLISLLQDSMTTINASFSSGGLYTYKVTSEQAAELRSLLKKGDTPFVITPTSRKNPYPSVAEVMEVHDEAQIDLDAPYKYKWIMGIVDITFYHTAIEREQKAADLLRDAERIRQKHSLLEAMGLTNGHKEIADKVREALNGPTTETETATDSTES